MHPVSRRRFLLGAGAAAALAACGDDGEAAGDGTRATTATTTGATAEPTDAAGLVLGATFDRNGMLVAGVPQRAAFVLFESSGGLVAPAAAPGDLEFVVTPEGGQPLDPVVVARHGDDVGRPYWPLETTFPAPGIHAAAVEVDGSRLELTFQVNAAGDVGVPQVGDPLPSARTPTVADPLGVQTVCTATPPCPLHEVSLADALAAQRPVALLVSTPAYCQVAICGPVLDLLVAAGPDHPDVALVHLEVYPNGEPSATNVSPVVVDDLGLVYEPVLFVTDAGGVVTARLDNIYDGAELEAALRGATA